MNLGGSEFFPRVAWALSAEVPFILGRLDVFRNYCIEFREFEDKIIIEKVV